VEKKQLVERDKEVIAVRRQCELLGLSRSSYYYSSTRGDEYNIELMRLWDEQYAKVPFYGVRRLTVCLRAQGCTVNPKRVGVLMRRMGLQAIYPHKRRSFSSGLGIPHTIRGYFGHATSKKSGEMGILNS